MQKLLTKPQAFEVFVEGEIKSLDRLVEEVMERSLARKPVRGVKIKKNLEMAATV